MPLTRRQLTELQNRTGIIFRNPAVLQEAFIHRSYLNENRGIDLKHNERLEFLGDAVLEMAITQFLLKTLPDAPERKLTSIRSAMVNWKILSQIAEEFQLGDYLFMSCGERLEFDAGKRSRMVILANTFEALLGAIYTDRGPGMVELFLTSALFPRLKDIVEQQRYIDPKSCLQKLSQGKWGQTPTYQMLKAYGPDHDKHFVMAVYCGDHYVGEGTGPSKAEAEMEAARDALRNEFQVTLAR